jgi:hypothetical protein
MRYAVDVGPYFGAILATWGSGTMRFGPRRPSIRGRISARLSPRRQMVNRLGLRMPRGYGWVRNPKKFVSNKVYRRTTFDVFSLLRRLFR